MRVHACVCQKKAVPLHANLKEYDKKFCRRVALARHAAGHHARNGRAVNERSDNRVCRYRPNGGQSAYRSPVRHHDAAPSAGLRP